MHHDERQKCTRRDECLLTYFTFSTTFQNLTCLQKVEPCRVHCGCSSPVDTFQTAAKAQNINQEHFKHSLLITEQDVWAPGRLGAGACASEILGVGQSSNVYAIKGTRYFHQSNFYFKHHHFHREKIYLLRIVCIDPASISVKEGLFSSKQHTLRNNSLHLNQG